ncbi:DDE Tnp IS1595 domain-containing protein [Aphis craccivora]|uniref:DDE Tnp IS1595 domain-containing protein n=1 Tax=Aphis craccivora TaxID=307492 RepID=A0A6G0Z3N0_APHCR|nr:DDE Tnp IS1595 domain-containing protein [Aphis craccivora]
MSELNLLQIFKLFNCNTTGVLNEDVLILLQNWNLIPKERVCLCSRGHKLKLSSRNSTIDGYNCRKGIFFYKSHLPAFKIISFSYVWLQNVTQSFIIKELGVSRATAVDWSNFNREIVYDGLILKRTPIGGVGLEVEIDESKFGKRKYNRGHLVVGQWVFVGVLKIIEEWILPGPTITSDCWKTYDCLEEEGYKHFKVNHSVNYKDPESGQYTNTIEGLWRHAKFSLPQFHRKKQFIVGYLANFMSQKNRKLSSQTVKMNHSVEMMIVPKTDYDRELALRVAVK